jgi:hypothetical protein
LNVGYYVTARRSTLQTAWLAGPFPTQEEAARIVACILDPWCDFDAFGTARLERANALSPGRLHALVGF